MEIAEKIKKKRRVIIARDPILPDVVHLKDPSIQSIELASPISFKDVLLVYVGICVSLCACVVVEEKRSLAKSERERVQRLREERWFYAVMQSEVMESRGVDI